MATLLVHSESFRKHLSLFPFEKFGDSREREYGPRLRTNFVNCERFWQQCVFPSTERVTRYPEYYPLDIAYRPDVDERVVDIATLHYSMLSHLGFAWEHVSRAGTELQSASWFEDFYVHLVSACDLAEELMEKFYLLLLHCRAQPADTLERLTRDQFLALAGEWYDESYHKVAEHYLAKGRGLPIELPSGKHLLREFVKSYLGRADLWKEYARLSQSLRTYRNHMVHDIVMGKLRVDGVVLVPRRTVITRYKRWADLDIATRDEEVMKRDFVAPIDQARDDQAVLETVLDQLWEVLLSEFEAEFYSNERRALRDLYSIGFQESDAREGDVLAIDWGALSPTFAPAASGVGNLDGDPASFPDIAAGSATWTVQRPPSPLKKDIELDKPKNS